MNQLFGQPPPDDTATLIFWLQLLVAVLVFVGVVVLIVGFKKSKKQPHWLSLHELRVANRRLRRRVWLLERAWRRDPFLPGIDPGILQRVKA